MLRFLAILILLCGFRAHAQEPWSFLGNTIDLLNAGDCKAIGDLDLDGKGDAIIGGSSLHWYESGAGYAKHTIRSSPQYKEFTTDCQAADVDGDGDIDIIISDGHGTSNVLWYENPRINGPQGPTGNPRVGADWRMRVIGSQGNSVHDIEVADLDNDGTLEVVTSGHGITRVWKRWGKAWVQRDLSGMAGEGIFIGDVDRDGRKDLATARGWIWNPGDVIHGNWVSYPIDGTTSGNECVLVDLNGDGRLDLFTCEAHFRAAMYWFEQPAQASSSTWTRRTVDAFMGAHHPEAADFNGDGRQDLLAGLELSEVAVYLNQGGSPPTFQKRVVALLGGHNARRGDMTGDGLPDILACDFVGNPPVSVHINKWCYPNCDASQASPMLTINDFVCFVNSFVAGSAYANCNGGGLNILDFQCYISRFVQGCP